jgi:DNA-binding Xre family transcriptional regulator
MLASVPLTMLRLTVKELAVREGIENAFQLAQVSGLPYATCRRVWEGRPRLIGMDTLETLCKVLHVRPSQLFDFEYEADRPRRPTRRR